MNSLIEFRGVTLGYGRKVVLEDLNFTIPTGDYFGLVGPNGAGKTTILRAILGTLRPLAGNVVIRGGANALRFGYVPQRDTIDYIMPHTVWEVVMMGRYRRLGPFRRPRHEDEMAVHQSLAHVAIDDLRDRTFNNLSGGQKQRVLIARALAAAPEVLILDEPTNGMDLSSRTSILELISRLHEEDRLTIIMVSHLLDDVAAHVKHLAIVEQNFFQVGDVGTILTSENLTTLYRMNVSVEHLGGNTVIVAGGHHERS